MIEIHNADPDPYRNTVTHSSVDVYDADDECLVDDEENENESPSKSYRKHPNPRDISR